MAVNVSTALALVKARLNRLEGDTSLDAYLTARIKAAEQEIEGTGIATNETEEDLLDVVDLAVFHYQNRDKTTGMPEWLRMRLRNRWLRQGARANDP